MEQVVYDLFKKLGIDYEVIRHAAVFKALDSESEKIDFKGAICCKNLLLKAQKTDELFLVSLSLSKRANLKLIANELRTNRLTFANEEDLTKNLGVKSGSASLLNITLNPKTKVKFVIDKALLDFCKVCFHPNVNTASICFSPNKIEEILNYYNANYIFLDM